MINFATCCRLLSKIFHIVMCSIPKCRYICMVYVFIVCRTFASLLNRNVCESVAITGQQSWVVTQLFLFAPQIWSTVDPNSEKILLGFPPKVIVTAASAVYISLLMLLPPCKISRVIFACGLTYLDFLLPLRKKKNYHHFPCNEILCRDQGLWNMHTDNSWHDSPDQTVSTNMCLMSMTPCLGC